MRFKCPFEHASSEGELPPIFLLENFREFKTHMKSDHPDKDLFCMVCGEESGSKELLLEHLQKHKGVEGRFLPTCDHCGKRFLSEYGMTAHKK